MIDGVRARGMVWGTRVPEGAQPVPDGGSAVRLSLRMVHPQVRIDSSRVREELGYRSFLSAGRHEAELAARRWMEGLRRRAAEGEALLPVGDGRSGAEVIADIGWQAAVQPVHRGVTIDCLPRSRPEVTVEGGTLTTEVAVRTRTGTIRFETTRSI